MSGRRRMPRRAADADGALLAWGAGYVIVGVVLATLTAWPVYQSPRLVLVAVGGTALGLGVVLLSHRFRWGALLTGGAWILGFLLVVVPLAIPAALASPVRILRGVRDGALGTVLGWKQLLTLTLPVGEYQAVLVPFLVVVALGSLVAGLLALRGGRAAPLAVLVVVGMAAFGIAFGTSQTSDPLALGPLLVPAPRELALGGLTVLVSLAWLLGRTRLVRARALRSARSRAGTVRQGRASAWVVARRNALATILVVVAVAGGLAAAPAAAELGQRSALRDEVEPSLVIRREPSPLAAYRAAFTAERFGTELFTVSGDRGGVDRLRLATLDAYDGEEFHVSDAASEAGRFRRLPRSAPGSASTVSFEVVIGEGARGIWVPAPDGLETAPAFEGPRAEELADGFFVGEDDTTSIEVAEGPNGVRGLQAGDAYRVVAAEPADRAALVEGFNGESGGDPLIDAADHPALVAWVRAQDLPRTGAGLLELVERLRDRGYLSHSLAADEEAAAWIAALGAEGPYAFRSSAAGHSTARIERLFQSLNDQEQRAGEGAAPELLVAAPGDDEQFAVAAALLARSLGFGSRVVVGVRLAEGVSGAEGAETPACVEVCTGGQLAAWAEVRTAAGRWVPLDATPQHLRQPIDIAEGEQLPQNATVPDELSPELIDPPQAQSDDTAAPADPREQDDSDLGALWPVLRTVGLGVGGALCLALPFLVLLGAKRLRRAGRRGAADPEVRIVGAWEELADLSLEHGIPFDPAATRASAALVSGRPAAIELAAIVDHAVFAEHPPSPELADRAWELVAAERERLAREQPLGVRLRAALSLAAFRRHLAAAARSTELRPFRRKETA